MDKEDFLNCFNVNNEEEKLLILNIFEKIKLSKKVNKIVYLKEFYTPNIWKPLLKISSYFNINLYTEGIFNESQRKMLAFSNKLEDFLWFPLEIIKIDASNNFKKLKHKDFLGSILSLGIERNKIGDLIIKNNIGYIPVFNNISDYIVYNLDYINKIPCKVEILDNFNSNIPTYKFEEKILIISSLRIDSIVSKICNVSRNEACNLINRDKVLIDYSICSNKNNKIEENNIITIRGYGKFIFKEILGNTKKENIKVLLKKFT